MTIVEVRDGRVYTEEHEWIEEGPDQAKVGITDWAQDNLTDVVYVELPEAGTEVAQGDEFAVLESVKAAAEVYAPASGTIVEVNHDLEDHPEKINDSPYEEGWLVVIEVDDPKELQTLMGPGEYEEYTAGL